MSITAQDIVALLDPVKGTTFAQLVFETDVKPSAANKHISIRKLTSANVQLFANTKDFLVFKRQVERSTGIEDYKLSDTWFHHTPCFSIVEHNTNGKQYLYAIMNSASSSFTIDGVAAVRLQVADLLTPAAKRDLLNPQDEVYNKTNDVKHNVHPRVIELGNIKSVRAMKQEITA
jgi:hypothetical protein